MKNILQLMMIIALLITATPAFAAKKTVTLDVKNMYCAACPYTVKNALSAVKGVDKVSVSYNDKTAIVTFDDARTNIASLTSATTQAGYPSAVSPQ